MAITRQTEKPGKVVTGISASGVTAEKFVGFDGEICGAGLKARGASRDDYDSNTGMYPLALDGEVFVTAGDQTTPITNGLAVASDASGCAIAAAATKVVNGWAVVPSGVTIVAGQKVLIQLGGGYVVAGS